MKKVQLGIRILIAVVLLLFVWINAHWSVALLLSLLVTGMEIQTHIQVRIIRELKEVVD